MPNKHLILLFAVFFASSLRAQNFSGVREKLADEIVYQSPVDGEHNVTARTTIIVRPQASIVRSRTAGDFFFSVFGEQSGGHQGKVLISDDHETVIFKPDHPFVLNEHVHVILRISGAGIIAPVSYSFHITQVTDSAQNYSLNLLREKEKNEIAESQKATDIKQILGEAQSIPLDTVPSNFPKIVIDIADTPNMAAGNIFLVPGGSNFITIVDNNATPLFEREMLPMGAIDFKMESGSRLSYCKLSDVFFGGVFSGQVFLLNSHYVVTDSFQCGNGYTADGHDFLLLPNGHAIMEAVESIDTDMRKVTGDSNAAKHAKVFNGIIQELDLKKNVVFQWKTSDHFKIHDMTNYDLTDPNHTVFDYAHVNSVEVDTDSNIIASFRNMDEVTKINRKNGKIIWRWGGKNNYFTFAGDTLQFSNQHDARRIANGHITIWDNGDNRKTIWLDGSYHDTSYSRAVEYDLDENSLTATAVWEDFDVPYSSASGNVQRLSNGNTFMGFGTTTSPNAIEVTPSGKKVFQLSLPHSSYNYRTFRFEWPQPASVASLPGTANSFALGSIYPNPTVNTITVPFSVAGKGVAQIKLLDLLGNTRSQVNEYISEEGAHSVSLDVHELPPGVYYCKLSQNGNAITKMVVLQK